MATRKNASPNPSLKNNNTGWGGGSTPTRSTGLSGLPRTTGAHYSVNSFASLPTITAGAGETWTLSCYFQNNTGVSLGSKTVYFVCKKPGDDFTITTSVALPTGTTRVSITGVTLTGTTGLYMLIDSFDATLGSGVEITGVLFEKVGALDVYFDGDDAGASWDGTNGNSSSTLTTGTDTFITDPVAGGGSTSGQADGIAFSSGGGGGSTSGQPDGIAFGTGAGGGSTAGQADGLALGTLPDGGGTGGQPDGLTVATGSTGGSTGGSADGVAVGTGSGGGSTGGQPDTLPAADVAIADPVQRGASTGGHPDTVNSGTQVVHDQMVMPIADDALACMVQEVAKLANPPAQIHQRPGAVFTAMADDLRNECCEGIGFVRPGLEIPTGGDWPNQLSDVDGPSRGRIVYWAVQIEIGIYRCIPIITDHPDEDGTDAIPRAAQWRQAMIDQLDDAAALRRVVCCMKAKYGDTSVLSTPVTPLENEANCGGITLTMTVRAPACDDCG